MPSTWMTLTAIGYFVGSLFAGEALKNTPPDDADEDRTRLLKKLKHQEECLNIFLGARFRVRDVAATRRIGIDLADALLGCIHKSRLVHEHSIAQACAYIVSDALDLTRDDKSLDGAHAIFDEMDNTLGELLEHLNAPAEDDPYTADSWDLGERIHAIFFPPPKKGPRRLYCADGRYVCASDKPQAKAYLRDTFGLVVHKVESMNLRQKMADGRPFGALIEGLTEFPCLVGVEG